MLKANSELRLSRCKKHLAVFNLFLIFCMNSFSKLWISSWVTLTSVSVCCLFPPPAFIWFFSFGGYYTVLWWGTWGLLHYPAATAAAAAAAKSLQLCPTQCNPINGIPPGSPVPGILQARTLEWVAISFSNAWKWKVKMKSLSRVRFLATSWIAAYQAPLSMGFSRQDYWSGVPLPSPLHYPTCIYKFLPPE